MDSPHREDIIFYTEMMEQSCITGSPSINTLSNSKTVTDNTYTDTQAEEIKQ